MLFDALTSLYKFQFFRLLRKADNLKECLYDGK